jgi:hypothetical protein
MAIGLAPLILQNRARRKWRKCPRMACRTPRGCRLPQIDQCQVDYTAPRARRLRAHQTHSSSSLIPCRVSVEPLERGSSDTTSQTSSNRICALLWRKFL